MEIIDVGVAIPVNRKGQAIAVVAGVKVYREAPLAQVAHARGCPNPLSRFADSYEQ